MRHVASICCMFASLRHERKRTHTRGRQPEIEPALEGQGAGVRGRLRHSAFICCMFAYLRHEAVHAHARRQPEVEPAPAGQGAGVRGRLRHAATICCMFASLRHEAAHARVSHRWSRRQRGRGVRFRGLDASRGVHVLHVDQGRQILLV